MSKKSLGFVAVCPACSKRNQFEISTLGSKSICQFCGKRFKAVSADSFSAALDDPLVYWIEFTDHGLIADDDKTLGPSELGDCGSRIERIPR